ncbi:GNAT family N-acetyltransferase [Clostridium nigeriense]|uniref:GNAT family N-acetyltransferase n=1 Tax=Clostridium nigeriense TaxID=1805470 RepID=UPI003D32CAB9
MKLKLIKFTELFAKEVCDWKYEDEYSVYNYPEWNKALKDQWASTIEEKRTKEFFAIVDDYNNLCGYIRLQDKESKVLVGVGIKPSLCGQKLGSTVMEILKQKCRELYPSKEIILEVRSFNVRAIKCYEKAGFMVKEVYKKTTPIGTGEFIKMIFNY